MAGKKSTVAHIDDATHEASDENQHGEESNSTATVNAMITTRIHASRMEEALLQEKPNPWRKSLLRLYACIFIQYCRKTC